MPLTPTPGAAATEAGIPLVPGGGLASDLDEYINRLADYLATRTPSPTPVGKGGTNATTAAQARTNLAVVGTAEVYNGQADRSGYIVKYNSGGTVTVLDPSANGHAATKRYVDDKVAAIPAGGVPSTGGTFTGNVFFPNAVPATSGYQVAYINGDGRLSRNASSERYKKYISEIDPAGLGDIWPNLVRYQMRLGDGSWKYGYIAERLDESDDLRPFVIYATVTEEDAETGEYVTRLAVDENGAPVPDSIDFIALLMAQNAQLHQAVDLLAQRLDALEGR